MGLTIEEALDEVDAQTQAALDAEIPSSEYRPADVGEVARFLFPVERMRFFDLLDGKVPGSTLTLRQWIERNRPTFRFFKHNEVLIDVLQDVADDLLHRVMVFEPPRHGKSELVSRIFPAYYLYRHPERMVGLSSYGQDLSDELSLAARTNYIEAGGKLNPARSGIRAWRTIEGGGLWAAGVGGPATGKGWHLGIIDDPYKDHEEALSPGIRKSRNTWYDAIWKIREQPGGPWASIIVMTRWHREDIVGWIIKQEREAPQYWHVVKFEALKRPPRKVRRHRPGELDDPERQVGFEWPKTVTLEPDWRQPGEPLAPEIRTRKELESLRRSYGGEQGYYWSALFQQEPIPGEGGTFKKEWFIRIRRSELPRMVREVIGWDFAATEGGGDHTAGLHQGKARDRRYYILGFTMGQWSTGTRNEKARDFAERRGFHVHQRGEQEPGAAGKEAAEAFIRLFDGFPRSTVPSTTNKVLRAGAASATAQGGLYYIVDEPWADELLQILNDFGPGADIDDPVDALSIGHNFLARGDLDPSAFSILKR